MLSQQSQSSQARKFNDAIEPTPVNPAPVDPTTTNKIAVIPTSPLTSTSEVIRINVGGKAFIDVNGDQWSEDKYFQGGSLYSTTASINKSLDDTLFKSERFANNFSYAVPVENGDYKVNLKFAEIYWNQNNQRVFDVALENNLEADNLDIHSSVGGDTAFERTFDVTVQDGVLNLDLDASLDNAKLSGIEIIPIPSPDVPPAPNPSPGPSPSPDSDTNIVDVNLNVLHTVGGESTFDRKKWITVHSDNTDPDWNGEADKLDYLVNDLDVYFGRSTGGLTYSVLNNTPAQMLSSAKKSRNSYGQKSDRHQYESNQDLIIGNQARIYEEMSGAEAGRRTAAYINNYFGSGGADGMPRPQYVELMNEPIVGLDKKASVNEIFDYHLDMAREIRANAPDVKIGGYTAAYPNFEGGNFNLWNTRWKAFIDQAGDQMDFYSFHLYDNGPSDYYRTGSNNEAIMDMIEQYGTLTGRDKPFVISEYGSLFNAWSDQPWSPQRDWFQIQSMNSMMMQFMERPDQIAKAVPFTVLTAEWGFGNGVPYNHRMMRKANEPNAYTGDWEWTDFIKFYELWQDVKGSRVDSIPSNINIQTDAYVNDNKAFVILNSLSTDVEKINLRADS